MGGVGNYQQFAAGKAMLGAGEGMSKGGGGGDGGGGAGLMGGAGLGVGMAMAQMLVKDNRGGTSLAPVAAGVQCKLCNATVAPGKFCAACGKGMESSSSGSAFCGGCGGAMAPDAKFCASCGRARS